MFGTTRVLAPVLSLAVGLALSVAGSGPAHAGNGGPTGSRFTLATDSDYDGYDAVTASDGTTYVGWISDDYSDSALRQVHLCVLPANARACSGGVQTADSLGPSSATDLHVVDSGGQVSLVWFAQVAPSDGEFSGVFGVATVSNGVLGASATVGGAPTLGDLYSAIPHPGGGISLASVGSGTYDQTVYYYPTIGAAPSTVHASYYVGNAQIADNGSQTVLTTSAYGSLGDRVSVASKASAATAFGGLSAIPKSYTSGSVERLKSVGSRIWMLGMSTKELYTPYTFRWTGHGFAPPRPTGDPDQGGISTVDLATDSSGRLAAVTQESGQLAVSNLDHSGSGAVFALPFGGTFAGGVPQISTSPSGRGYVFYGFETTGATGYTLVAQPVHLAGLTRTVHAHGKAGSLTLVGPATCLPVSKVTARLTAKPNHGWKVASRSLRLGSATVHGTVNGAALKPHHHYTLEGKVEFRNGSGHATLAKQLSFTTCGRP